MIAFRAMAVGAAVLLAGCAVVPQVEQAPESVEVVQPVATQAPAPAPAPTPTPTPTGPGTFLFNGELTQGGWIRGQAPGGTVTARLGDQELALDDEGRFFAAFDRDAGGSAELVARLEDGREIRSPITVSPRAWDIEHINAARRPGGSSEAFMRRRQPELDAIWDARTANSDSDGWQQDFIWPVTGRISGRFGSQRVYRGEPGSYHSGLDIAPGAGVPFVAPADGVVTLAAYDPFSLEGHLIIIDHGAGLNSAFLHASQIFVTEGQRVEQGDRLGLIGATGRATGPHLHWSIKWHLARLDPLLFLGPMP
ncbi:M23 family metallopeptidase [Aurantiacibacter sp. D1-12]|uniref:M23 family metallopeptidase n=1 Tax=Aurantiacibacter sp. D1-12 TaxID=2993658 RepID=UPI00237C6840|nr:M23 family metallopeptidase [Aurantiacibacter sp. D1-12]MDE1468069.1 M23 family metallopeptidase [Aurantiacibacter sp. D1-12]